MRKAFAAAILIILCFIPVSTTLAQSGNASVGGFVQDSTQAFIPGVTVTATNTQTGVATTVITNESGTYTIPSLLPGTYKLTAELAGFRTQVINDVQLGQGVTARYNFTLQVGAVTDSVEVTAQATALIAETSPTIGQVLTERQVRDLPLASNNVLDLMQTMAGVRGATLGEATTFAGISTGMVNTVRDGLSVQNGRYANGVGATTQVHPDMVGEFRVILTPVDAEMGRGNGQVQILTRSGTNQLHGSGAWFIRNSALDANTWVNNKQVVNGVARPGEQTWINRNEFTGSAGGPIIKNRTFFFTLFDKQFERQRQTVRPIVLTDCARNGIFRYWEGWGNGSTQQQTVMSGVPTIASVDSFGNPVRPAVNPNGTPYTGQLRYFSVFGPLANTPTKPDCSDAVVESTAWDVNRTRLDPGGVTQKFLAAMPHANVFDAGDGLNTAVHQWVRRGHNAANYGLATGTNFDADREQINAKIDHNFNAKHKIAVNYSYEWLDGDYLLSIMNAWPGNFTSETIVRPKVLTLNFTSTLTASLLNEARFGFRESYQVISAPGKRKVPESFLLKGGQGFQIGYVPAPVGPTTAQMSANNYFCLTNCAQQGNKTPLTSYADTISWTKGKHAFKGGFDTRFTYTRGSETPTAPIPRATGGAGLNPNAAFSNSANLPGLVSTNQSNANSLLYFLAGSVDNAFQYYFIQSPDHNNQWLSYIDKNRKITEPHQNEFALFFKDDWKLHPSFTLNAGIRYEYYGVPYEGQGLTIRPVGGQGGLALFGVSGRSFDRWMRPDNGVNTDLLMQVEFVGPKTNKPNETIYPNDWNNFGPAVGFAWELPWFGKGKTNVRGGYQISYVGGGHAGNLSNFIFTTPGFLNQARTQGPVDGTYFDTRNLPGFIPIPPPVLPMQPIPLQKVNQNASAFDPNYYTPYIQNLTLSITREISRNLTLDVRYIGTRGIGLTGFFDLNTPNVFQNAALFNALERTRRGENVELFDQMFLGLNLNPNVRGCDLINPTALCGAVDGVTQRGSQHLRLNTTFRDALANGDYYTVSNSLNVYNGTGSGPSGAVPGAGNERGNVLRRANRGFNVPGGTTVPGGPVVPAGLFPENWITANPQFAQANYWTNSGKSNYHSLQVQGTLRPARGMSVQGTYIWSRSLETPLVGAALGSGLNTVPTFTDPTDRNKDYALSPNHVTHDFRSYGVFELPFGPGRLLFRNSSGVVSRLIEGWQTSFIVNASTGQPASISASYLNGTTVSPTGLHGAGTGAAATAASVPDVVGPFSSKGFGQVQWNGDYGSFFGSSFARVPDPQCATVAAELKPYCTIQAITDAKTGQILLQNPKPGKRGTLGRQTMEMPGIWTFDAALAKTVRISESKNVQIRMDATNILNHPNVGNCTATMAPFCNPVLNINGTNSFGFIQEKGDQRRYFKGSVRLNF
ncbi:MAG: hypothetical protein DMG13_10200 [Acidobacteria bacterium]|nr:MAG: hypothetical protein DMG13_10200 [Acidobacteriota bacterium]